MHCAVLCSMIYRRTVSRKRFWQGHVTTNNPGPNRLLAMQRRWTKCGEGRRLLEKERTLLRAAREVSNTAIMLHENSSWADIITSLILKVKQVFVEMLQPCRHLCHLLWILSFCKPSLFGTGWWILSLTISVDVAFSAIICWLIRTKGWHCIIFCLWDDVLLALHAGHVPHHFQAQGWWQLRFFLNLRVPAASVQPAHVPRITSVMSMPVCTC